MDGRVLQDRVGVGVFWDAKRFPRDLAKKPCECAYLVWYKSSCNNVVAPSQAQAKPAIPLLLAAFQAFISPSPTGPFALNVFGPSNVIP